MCQEFCLQGGGAYTPLGRQADTLPGRALPRADTPRQTPPWTDTRMGRPPPPYQTATAADFTHPTGMHSCFFMVILLSIGMQPVATLLKQGRTVKLDR